jgi:hypothetical protein
MHWLRLTRQDSGLPIWINLAQATSIRISSERLDHKATLICYGNDDQDWVNETPEEILAQIPVCLPEA